jgi:8-oxo-dGTP pyrophosphatase MutT (NUDIX family)
VTTPSPTGSGGGKTKYCDHTAVGVLISSPAGLLVFERARPPARIAPVAGHVDQHGGPEQAARNEVDEEVGLTVTSLHLLTTEWRPNRCRRPTSDRVGHYWSVYEPRCPDRSDLLPRRCAPPDGYPRTSSSSTHTAPRRTPRDSLSEEQFTAEPGLEPVWVRFLHELELVTLPDDTLSLIEKVL